MALEMAAGMLEKIDVILDLPDGALPPGMPCKRSAPKLLADGVSGYSFSFDAESTLKWLFDSNLITTVRTKDGHVFRAVDVPND